MFYGYCKQDRAGCQAAPSDRLHMYACPVGEVRESARDRGIRRRDVSLVVGAKVAVLHVVLEQTDAVSRSGQRVIRRRSLRSSSAAFGTSTLNDVTSPVVAGKAKYALDDASVRTVSFSEIMPFSLFAKQGIDDFGAPFLHRCRLG